MAVSQAQIDEVRLWVSPDVADDDEVYTQLAALGSPRLAAHRLLKRFLTEITSGPKFSITGYSEDWSKNIDVIREQIATLEQGIEAEAGGSGASRLVRRDRCGR